ncbi:c-type cytochrome biogenesis protein CcmI, partial [Reyranella sp.]
MLEFLLALLTTATVAALLWPLLRMRLPARDRLSGELAIYRDQLAELERERAAGTLKPADAAAGRTE